MKNRFLSSLSLATTIAVGMVGVQGLNDKSSAVILSQTAGYPTVPISSTPTDFTAIPLIPDLLQFNPALGTLTSVEISLQVTANGTFGVENLGPSPQTVEVTQGATVSLSVPAVSVLPLVVSVPNFTDSANLGPFDGTIDFGGTSGFTFAGFNATPAPTVTVLTAGVDDLTPFIGLGTIVANVSGIGTSATSGSGNLVTSVRTNAGALVNLTYNFTPTTPPPITAVPELSSTLGLLVLGGLGLAKSLKRKEN